MPRNSVPTETAPSTAPSEPQRDRKVFTGPGPASEGAVAVRAAGTALYGTAWQTALAAAIEPHHPNGRVVNVVLVKRWASGARSVPGWVWPAIEAVAVARRRELDDAMAEVLRLRDIRPDATFREAR